MGYATFDAMWQCAVSRTLSMGDELNSRAGKTREVLAYAETLVCPEMSILRSPARNMSIIYASAELLWYIAESKSAALILAYAPSYSRFIDANGEAFGHYGYRWRQSDSFARFNCCRFNSQIDVAIEYLKKSPETRQCVIDIWNAGDILQGFDGQCKDIPCTLCLQLLARNGKLHWITTMRSNDLWLGMPYDVFCFTAMQKLIASAVGLELGQYHHRVGSLHAYEKDWPKLMQPVTDLPNYAYSSSPRESISYRQQTERALTFETAARVVPGVLPPIVSLDGVHPVLRDAALCCALKWCYGDRKKLISEMTQPAVKERANAYEPES
jgi:thymidylate synthase